MNGQQEVIEAREFKPKDQSSDESALDDELEASDDEMYLPYDILQEPVEESKASNGDVNQERKVDTTGLGERQDEMSSGDESDKNSDDVSHSLDSLRLPIEQGKAFEAEIRKRIEADSHVSGLEQKSIEPKDELNFLRVEISPNLPLVTNDEKPPLDLLVQILNLRRKYMDVSQQSFPVLTNRFLDYYNNQKTVVTAKQSTNKSSHQKSFQDSNKSNEETSCQLKTEITRKYYIGCNNGVFQIYESQQDIDKNTPIEFKFTNIDTFIRDMQLLHSAITNGPLKTFTVRCLKLLQHQFQVHEILNQQLEASQLKSVPRRDFYNVRKVDNDLHASTCMNQTRLLHFIKKHLNSEGDRPVQLDKNGNVKTLKQVFHDLNLTSDDLTVDILDVHCGRSAFQRFDKYINKRRPIGKSSLRELFLKIDNYLEGEYLAKIVKDFMSNLKESRYQQAELRISIHGRSNDEWSKLAKWTVKWDVYSDKVVWLIQIPRVYDSLKSDGVVESFGDVLGNIFKPLFEVTNNPQTNPELYSFLQHVTGFDIVGDESNTETNVLTSTMQYPQNWIVKENPPHWYYLYYIFTNVCVLNQFRKERGLNTFTLRPHCGATGPIRPLVASFLLAQSISQGLMLQKVPVLQYLYYLSQVGITMSPMSDNSIFLRYSKHPFYDFFTRGLVTSLGTNSPLQFHFTSDPLMEEYAVATQVWTLTATDQVELAKNSVLLSGFPNSVKTSWLGLNYKEEGTKGNDIAKTKVPDIRITYRHKSLHTELSNLFNAV
ncbi:AMP deaminase 2-like [Artemia franciscana]|uniref:AMP deaminase 2-like n=1 Tax=Artemia franciscana TaxID=6661 RepID=UPI0032DA94C9